MDHQDFLFKNRHAAGELLAEKLHAHAHQPQTVVLALPRGGVPVGAALAEALDLPLDVLVVRKLGLPYHEECAMGAIASGGQTVFNADVLALERVSQEEIARVIARESAELQRRELRYRGGRAPHQLEGQQVILVDDGIATGSTMQAAIRAARAAHASHVTVAVPVLPQSALSKIKNDADAMVYLAVLSGFYAVGQYYADFHQTSDEEVIALLANAAQTTSNRFHLDSSPSGTQGEHRGI